MTRPATHINGIRIITNMRAGSVFDAGRSKSFRVDRRKGSEHLTGRTPKGNEMTRQQAIEQLTVSLTEAIEQWSEEMSSDNEGAWEEVGWVGDDLQRLMAKAAMATLEASIDVQDYMRENGELKND